MIFIYDYNLVTGSKKENTEQKYRSSKYKQDIISTRRHQNIFEMYVTNASLPTKNKKNIACQHSSKL